MYICLDDCLMWSWYPSPSACTHTHWMHVLKSHLATWLGTSIVRQQQVTHDNLILQLPEKQAQANICPSRTNPAPGLAAELSRWKAGLGGAVCRAHYADDDPENVSAAVGGRRKQVGLPQVLRGRLRLHTKLMAATLHLYTTFWWCQWQKEEVWLVSMLHGVCTH